ncbi:MAG: cory-CC-star protein [Aquificota bacterium]|nr:cory-CC-star protein [Aquificota bacterium]
MDLSRILAEFYRLKFGQTLAREARNLDEVFLFFLFSDYFGIPNPYKILFLEVYPDLMEEFHRWHIRMGLGKSPLEWIRCC